MNTAAQMLIVRVGLRRVAAGCDRDFDRARGTPRQHDIRLRLEIQRMQRGAADAVAKATAEPIGTPACWGCDAAPATHDDTGLCNACQADLDASAPGATHGSRA